MNTSFFLMRKAIWVIFIIFLPKAKGEEKVWSDNKNVKSIEGVDLSGNRFFPMRSEIGFEEVLLSLKEQSIYKGVSEKNGKILRFTTSINFEYLYSMRLTWIDENIVVWTSEVKKNIGGNFNLSCKRLIVKKEKLSVVADIVTDSNFWNILSEDEILYNGGLGGENWLIEMQDRGVYSMVVLDRPQSIRISNEEMIKHKLNPQKIRQFAQYLNLERILKNITCEDGGK